MCFLTNGGGVTEEQKAEQLSGWLDVAVGVDQASFKLLHQARIIEEQEATDTQHGDAQSMHACVEGLLCPLLRLHSGMPAPSIKSQ